MAKPLKVAVTESLRRMLGQPATLELMKHVDPADTYLLQLKPGDKAPQVVELLAAKAVRIALDPKKANLEAIAMIVDRIDGKAVPGLQKKQDGRKISEKLDAVTTKHLNSIAAQVAQRQPGPEPEPEPDGTEVGPAQDGAGGPASRLLDLPQNRLNRP